MRVDISLGLFNTVILATETHVTRAHLNRIPDAVGVWQFDSDTDDRTVIRQPAELKTETPGIELGSDHSDHTEVHPVSSKKNCVHVVESLSERMVRGGEIIPFQHVHTLKHNQMEDHTVQNSTV